ncbi:MAG: beta strand repeat-containing protein [Bacteroidota bacterium]
MSEETENLGGANVADVQSSDVSTLDALHLDGKGAERLDDAEEHELPASSASDREDVKGLANVQSADRSTFEAMQDGAPAERGATPTGGQVIADVYTPSEPDHTVAAEFQNPFPAFSTDLAAEAPEEARSTGTAPITIEGQPVQDRVQPGPVADGPEQSAPRPAAFVPTPAAQVIPAETPAAPPAPTDPIITTAQQPTLTLGAASGVENQLTKLTIDAATNDTDGGGERLTSLTISGIPDGFVIVGADGSPIGQVANGTWTLTDVTPTTLNNIYLKNLNSDDDADFSGDFSLTVSVTTTESGGSATTTSVMPVHIEAVADTPVLVVHDSAGMENTWIDLKIDVTSKDTDGSESQSVYIADLPAGAQLHYTDAAGHTVTVAAVTNDLPAGLPAGTYYVVPAEYLDTLQVRAATDNSTDFTLTVHAVSTEKMNGDTAVTAAQTVVVDVGVVDPSASGSGVGNEDGFADLTLSAAINAKVGSETMAVYIENLPNGVILQTANGTALTTTTTVDADGVQHTGYDVTAYWNAATGSVTGLQVGWDRSHPSTTNLDTDIDFKLRAVVRDGDTDADSAAVKSAAPDVSDTVTDVHVIIKAVADTPTLSASAIGVEDKWFDLKIDAALTDTDGSEALTVYVSGLPDGAMLNHGTQTTTDITLDDGTFIPSGSWLVLASDLGDLQVKAAQDSDQDFALTLTAVATEGATGAQVETKTAGVQQTITVHVLSDADVPTVSVVDAAQHVNEDSFYNLRTALAGGGHAVEGSLTEHGGTDGQTTSADTSETLSFTITAKQESRLWIDADGDGVRDAGEIQTLQAGHSVTVSAADIYAGKVSVGGVADWASGGSNGTLKFDIVTTATEHTDDSALAAANGLVRSTTATSATDTLTLVVDPVHDSATIVAANTGFEDGLSGLNDNGADTSGTPIVLTPTITLTDTDGSEHPTGDVTITSSDAGMISGTLYLNGVAVTPTIDADGTYRWTISGATFTETAGHTWTLAGLSFQPAADMSGAATYAIGITTYDQDPNATTVVQGSGTITVTAVADVPTVTASNAATDESASGVSVDLHIAVASNDADGSETQYVYISGIPDAAGTLSVYAQKLTSDFSEDGVAIPASVANPVYKVLAADLDHLQLNIKPGYSSDLTLSVHGVSVESSNGDIAVSPAHTLTVDIGVLDPTITPGTLAGAEGQYVALTNVVVAPAADDATDTLSVYIEDLPAGFALYSSSGGSYTALHTTTYTSPDGAPHIGYLIPAGLIGPSGALTGVYVRSTSDYSDADITFTIRAVVTDTDVGTATDTAYGQAHADTAQSTQSVTVTVGAVANDVNLNVSGIGVEDKWFHLDIAATLKDTDGSEAITAITVTTPAGVELRDEGTGTAYGFVTNANGTRTYALTTAALGGLQIKAPGNSDADLSLTVKVTTTDSGTDGQVTQATQDTPKTVVVSVLSDADTPTVNVVDETQIIAEDSWYNLHTQLSDGSYAVGGSLRDTDGSETLTYVLTAKQASRIWIDADGDGVVDNGEVTTLSAGQSVTLSAANVTGGKVSVGGIANWASGSNTDTLKFDIKTVATEANGSADATLATAAGLTRASTADSVVDTLVLKVTPVADDTYVASVSAGVEDQVGGIAFAPTITLTDADGSETLSGNVEVLIAHGSMDGHLEFNHATLTSTGTVTISGVTYDIYAIPATSLAHPTTATYSLGGLVYVPNEDSDKDVTYRIRTTTSDTDNASTHVTTTNSATLTVKAVADAPIISVNGSSTGTITVTGNEDTPIHLNLAAALKDTDGSETITGASLQNVPSGWSVAYVNANGDVVGYATHTSGTNTWVLDLNTHTASQVVLIPPTNSDVDATGIVFKVTTTEHAGATSGDIQTATATATSTVTFNVQVDAVADAPTLIVTDARVVEDHVVKLDIRAALTDTDGSETLTVTIGNVPHDASFVDASGHAVGTYNSTAGTWTFAAAELNNLYYKPAANSNDDAQLAITATSTEASNGSTATHTATLNVIVTGDADAPYNPATGSVIHTGDVLTATGTEDQLINPNLTAFHSLDTDGSESLSVVISGIPQGVGVVMVDADGHDLSQYLKYIGNGSYSVAPEYVQYVRFSAPANYSGSFTVSTRLISTENDGDFERVDTTLRVTVVPVADAPGGSIGGTAVEDNWFDPVTHADTGVAFSLTAQVADTGGGNSAIGAGGSETLSDVDVTVDVSGLVAAHGGSTSGIYVTYNHATYSPVLGSDGKYSITIADLDIPPGQTSVALSGFTLYGVPENSSTDVPVSMVVTSTEGATHATATVTGSIAITPDADMPTLVITPAGTSDGVYDATSGSLTLNGHVGVTDTDGSESAYLIIGGVPNGVTVVGGINNGNGTWTLVNGTSVSQIQLVSSNHSAGTVNLSVTAKVIDQDPDSPAIDTAEKTVTVAVNYGHDTGGPGGTVTYPTATVSGTLQTSEDHGVSLSGLHFSATGTDGTSLTIGANGAVSAGSTQVGTLSVVVEIPAGWTISGTVYEIASNSATGTVTYTIPYTALSSVSLTPPADYSGDTYDLHVRAVVTTTSGWYDTAATTMTPVDLLVTPAADGANIATAITSVVEDDGSAALTITIKDTDHDHSESLSSNTVTIRVYTENGHSTGTLTSTDAGMTVTQTASTTGYTDYTVTLTAAQMANFTTSGGIVLSGLTFTPDTNYSGSVKVDVSVGVTDHATINGHTVTDSTTSVTSATITVNAAVDASTFDAKNVTGAEDSQIALDVTITHPDLIASGTQWSSETMNVVIGGVPAGATLVGAYNNGDGTWTVKDANLTYNANGTVVLNGVRLVPATDNSGDVTLTVTTYSREAGSSTWVEHSSNAFTVTVTAVTDGGSINPQAATGTEDHLVALDLGAQILDSSETATITIAGVPAGAAITDASGHEVGTKALQADGSYRWTLSSTEVNTLGLLSGGKVYFSGPTNVAGTWTLSATLSVQDTDAGDATPHAGAVVSTSAFSFTVTLAPEADMPTLTTSASTGSEDQAVALNINAGLTDIDGSETLTVTITGAPSGTVFVTASGAVISATTAANGTEQWIVPSNANHLAVSGLSMKTPTDYSGTVHLTVTATAAEGTSTATTTSQTVTVAVAAVNDAPVVDITAGVGIGAGNHTDPIPLLGGTATINITDVDNTTLSKVTVAIGGSHAGDTLGLTGLALTQDAAGNLTTTLAGGTVITIGYDHGMLTLSGTATMDQYETLLHSVIFTSSTGTLTSGMREVTVTAYDQGGASGSDGITVTVTGTATVSGNAYGSVYFTDDGSAHTSGGGLHLASHTIAGTEDTSTALSFGMEQLADNTMVTLTGAPVGSEYILAGGTHLTVTNAATGVSVTAAQLTGLTITAPDDYNGTINVLATAHSGASTVTETVSVSLAPVNDAPTLELAGATHTVTAAASSAIHLVDSLAITDVDSTTFTGMTVTLGGAGHGDSLALAGYDVTMGGNGSLLISGTGISVSYDGATHTLSLSGSAGADTYQSIANSIVLSNSDGTLDAGTRSAAVTVFDDHGAASTTLTSTTTLTDSLTLTGDALGDVRWGADGSTTVDDTLIVQYGDTVNYVNGGLGGHDTLMVQSNGHDMDWTFLVDANDSSVIHATSTSAPDKSFIVNLDHGTTATVSAGHDAVVFNGDASGQITFHDGTTVQFDNMERLV